ncbi:MAG: hypothetical protein ACLGPM_06615 [Acidobacteriota bacterium]
MDWAIVFPDGFYAYVKERWWASGVRIGGKQQPGHREHFSFHYGPTNPRRQPNRIPEKDKVKYPAIIRIDCDPQGPHLHFRDEDDHIEQHRVRGLTIEDSDPFDFMRAVIKHRSTNEGLDSILKFTVIP